MREVYQSTAAVAKQHNVTYVPLPLSVLAPHSRARELRGLYPALRLHMQHLRSVADHQRGRCLLLAPYFTHHFSYRALSEPIEQLVLV